MGDEHGISWPDGGMCASDSGMSYHSCNKPDYHYRVKQLEKGYDELRTICNRQKERIAELEADVERLRKALERLANPLACGCNPCTGDCRSHVALEAELEGRIDFAKAALEASDA